MSEKGNLLAAFGEPPHRIEFQRFKAVVERVRLTRRHTQPDTSIHTRTHTIRHVFEHETTPSRELLHVRRPSNSKKTVKTVLCSERGHLFAEDIRTLV